MKIPFYEYELTGTNPPEVRPKTYRAPKYRVALVREGSLDVEAPRFSNSRDGYLYIRKLSEELDREGFWILCLDAKNKLIGINLVSLGSLSASVVHPREAFKTAILLNSAAILAGHNHPSGDPTPSREDREMTQRLVEGGKILGIRVLDHIVAGEKDYFSFADSGLIAP